MQMPVDQLLTISKFLSYVLRHRPEEIDIKLDYNGWVDIDTLLDAIAQLKIDAAKMHADGFAFFVSDNGVWLTDHVPPQYIDFNIAP